ncbi:hypothetical protein [Halegenticoccus soli]|uniref:hypothetical protein n=1 Tax=Halegenticoccus soli TaxID=1985678 RepID=UPI000C6CEDAE|nr:hypothetical protein [Halegenticoccus soli]
MSELHWAIRASVYGHGITESKVEFVWEGIKELREVAKAIDYDIDLDFSYDEISQLVKSERANGAVAVFPQEQEGFFDRLVSDIDVPELDFKIDLPSLSELLD